MTARMTAEILPRADEPSEKICQLTERFGRILFGEPDPDSGSTVAVVVRGNDLREVDGLGAWRARGGGPMMPSGFHDLD